MEEKTFRCIRLKGSITVKRCLRNQKETIAFFGDNASQFASCPCAQGEEVKKLNGQKAEGVDMVKEKKPTKKKECRNCKRVMVLQQDGLCGACNGAVKRAAAKKGTPEYESALADARERVLKNNLKPGVIERNVRQKPEKAQDEAKPLPEKMKIVDIKPTVEANARVIPITLQINIEVNVRAIKVG